MHSVLILAMHRKGLMRHLQCLPLTTRGVGGQVTRLLLSQCYPMVQTLSRQRSQSPREQQQRASALAHSGWDGQEGCEGEQVMAPHSSQHRLPALQGGTRMKREPGQSPSGTAGRKYNWLTLATQIWPRNPQAPMNCCKA